MLLLLGKNFTWVSYIKAPVYNNTSEHMFFKLWVRMHCEVKGTGAYKCNRKLVVAFWPLFWPPTGTVSDARDTQLKAVITYCLIAAICSKKNHTPSWSHNSIIAIVDVIQCDFLMMSLSGWPQLSTTTSGDELKHMPKTLLNPVLKAPDCHQKDYKEWKSHLASHCELDGIVWVLTLFESYKCVQMHLKPFQC